MLLFPTHMVRLQPLPPPLLLVLLRMHNSETELVAALQVALVLV